MNNKSNNSEICQYCRARGFRPYHNIIHCFQLSKHTCSCCYKKGHTKRHCTEFVKEAGPTRKQCILIAEQWEADMVSKYGPMWFTLINNSDFADLPNKAISYCCALLLKAEREYSEEQYKIYSEKEEQEFLEQGVLEQGVLEQDMNAW